MHFLPILTSLLLLPLRPCHCFGEKWRTHLSFSLSLQISLSPSRFSRSRTWKWGFKWRQMQSSTPTNFTRNMWKYLIIRRNRLWRVPRFLTYFTCFTVSQLWHMIFRYFWRIWHLLCWRSPCLAQNDDVFGVIIFTKWDCLIQMFVWNWGPRLNSH